MLLLVLLLALLLALLLVLRLVLLLVLLLTSILQININRDPRWGRNQEVPSEVRLLVVPLLPLVLGWC